jgi:hypothetical protein
MRIFTNRPEVIEAFEAAAEGFTPYYRNRSRKRKDRETKATPDWPIRSCKKRTLTAA